MSAHTKKLTTLQTILLAMAVAALGFLLIVLPGHIDYFKAHTAVHAVLREFGVLIFVTSSLSVLWELFVKRAFLQEIVELVRLSENIIASGVERMFLRFYRDVPWDDLFADTTEFDLVVSYARTWRHVHRGQLQALGLNPNCRIRVVLANPDEEALVIELARRHSTTVEDVRDSIREAIRDFTSFLGSGAAKFELYLSNRTFHYNYYRFNTSIIISLVPNQNIHTTDRPGMLLNDTGILAVFFRRDFDGLISHALSQSEKPPKSEKQT